MRLLAAFALALLPLSARAHCHLQYQVIGPGGLFYQLDLVSPFRFLGSLPGGTTSALGPVIAWTETQQLELYHLQNVNLTATDLTGSVTCPSVSIDFDGPPPCTDDGAGGPPSCVPSFTISQTAPHVFSCTSTCASYPQPHPVLTGYYPPNSPAPPVTSVSPHSAMTGSPPDALEIRGSGFVRASQARWDGEALPTVYVDANTLLALVPANFLASEQTAGITVVNPAGASSPMSFAVLSSTGVAAGPPAAPAPDVRVFPNPWRPAAGVSSVTFDKMPAGSTVKVYSMAARLVKTLDASAGTATWDLTTADGMAAASGFYFYLVTSAGGSAHGRLALIR